MLDRLSPRPGARQKRKRVGRGPGSGQHKTAGRGAKGQGHRSNGKGAYFEGGQMPIARRIPKRGFTNIFKKQIEIVNLRDLASLGDGASIDPEGLEARGLVRSASAVKLLGEGDAPKNLTIKVHKISASAKTKVEAAGGSVEIIA